MAWLWHCEVGAGVGKVDMEMCGVSYEEWVGVDVDYMERVDGAFEVSVLSYSKSRVLSVLEEE